MTTTHSLKCVHVRVQMLCRFDDFVVVVVYFFVHFCFSNKFSNGKMIEMGNECEKHESEKE